MDSEAFQTSRDLLDLNFQSLAMKHMDLKQMELDTAVAKVDELTKQLESLWSDTPAPPSPQAGAPTRLTRYSSSPVPEPFGSRGSSRKAATDSTDTLFGRSESAPVLHPYSQLSPKGRPSSPRTPLYLQPDAYSSLDRFYILGSEKCSPERVGNCSVVTKPSRPCMLTLEVEGGSLGRGVGLTFDGPLIPVGPPKAPVEPEPEPELEGLLAPVLEAGDAEEGALTRPLSPTRLQPALPPEAQSVPELEEVARVLAEIPRPLKRRGSMEQSPAVALPPTHKKQYQQIISRLFHRHGPGPGGPEPELSAITEGSEARPGPPAPAPPTPIPPPAPVPSNPPEQPQNLEVRSLLRKAGSPRKARRARLNPLVLLLDAALTGELDVVQQAVKEMNDPSQPNEEGITALHNAICGANYAIVDFLIATGANVNSPDSHASWFPRRSPHKFSGDTPPRSGGGPRARARPSHSHVPWPCGCLALKIRLLSDVEQSMGLMYNGLVYALWDYSAEFGDELSFREGESVTVLRRDGPEEADWWWASLHGQEGYVPRNYFGVSLEQYKWEGRQCMFGD
ncbi:relA-associated inhibitor [Echinops telfairi]|uniref:RelA-associated inhibitor n=1 Tax=Echinops telfairi TaxID=9371 RepID=A0AC55DA39_ECHTE|nr:relA-associated inhibitor [Echinops telfairi]